MLKSSLPAGVDDPAASTTSRTSCKESIRSVRDAIIIGLVLAGLIIWLFLRDWGTAVMTGLVVPVTMVVTFIVMKILGQTFNLMTLGGLAAAVGLVIDDKIVVIENIVLHRDGGEGPLKATASAPRGDYRSPDRFHAHADRGLSSAHHHHGRHGISFFSALAIAMSVALFTSLVLALVWTSNLGSSISRFRRGQRQLRTCCHRIARSRMATGPSRRSRRMHHVLAEANAHPAAPSSGFSIVRALDPRCALKRPFILTGGCVALVFASCVLFARLAAIFFLAFDEGGFVLDYVMPPGSSLQETDRA